MKAFDFARSDLQRARGVYVIATVWLLAHVASLSPALEDIDSINFALGLHHYDPSQHQPHPPGYPVYIAAGRVALAVVHLVASGLSYVRADALSLSIWSAIGGAMAIVAAADLFRQLTSDQEHASAAGFWGALLMAVTPLFWITGLRPMSDMFGLGVALSGQALLLRGARDGRSLVAGAAIAGLAAGIRTQTIPLTIPLLLYAVYAQRGRGAWLVRPVAAFVGASLTWGVPLLVLTGGVTGYLAALGSQAGEDFAWVDMLWAHPTPRAIALAVYDSFLLPFANPISGGIIVAVALLGVLRMLFADRRAVMLLAIAYAPYVVFHLLFQEAANLRYATPLVVPIVFAAAFLACSLEGRFTSGSKRQVFVAAPLLVLLIVPSLIVGSFPGLGGGIPIVAGYVYGREPHPAFRAIDDMIQQAGSRRPAAVFSHFSLRRPLQAAPTTLPVIEPQRSVEWLAVEDYWLKGGTQQVWFLADPRRTDLALIDPQVRQVRQRTEYRWSVADRPELMGTRPLGVDWYRLDPPAWFAGEGWELTPETAGLARASNKRLQRQPITAYLRRGPEPRAGIIAGRDLGAASDPPSIIEMAIDGVVVEQVRIDPAKEGSRFFHTLQLPQGVPAGSGNYATVTLSARAEQPRVATPPVAVEQFDIQSTRTVMFGFGDGWQEAEYNNTTGVAWRWTSDRATLRVLPARDVVIHLGGESPLKYFDAPPTVRIRAGARELAVFHPSRDFSWNVKVPADALAASDGTVTIETDKVYLPGQVEGTADARRLGLRMFETQVLPAAP